MAKESYRRANFGHEEKLDAAERARTLWLAAAYCFLGAAFGVPLLFSFSANSGTTWVLVNVVLFGFCYLQTGRD